MDRSKKCAMRRAERKGERAKERKSERAGHAIISSPRWMDFPSAFFLLRVSACSSPLVSLFTHSPSLGGCGGVCAHTHGLWSAFVLHHGLQSLRKTDGSRERCRRGLVLVLIAPGRVLIEAIAAADSVRVACRVSVRHVIFVSRVPPRPERGNDLGSVCTYNHCPVALLGAPRRPSFTLVRAALGCTRLVARHFLARQQQRRCRRQLSAELWHQWLRAYAWNADLQSQWCLASSPTATTTTPPPAATTTTPAAPLLKEALHELDLVYALATQDDVASATTFYSTSSPQLLLQCRHLARRATLQPYAAPPYAIDSCQRLRRELGRLLGVPACLDHCGPQHLVHLCRHCRQPGLRTLSIEHRKLCGDSYQHSHFHFQFNLLLLLLVVVIVVDSSIKYTSPRRKWQY